MTKTRDDRIELLQGTLDLLILKTLVFGPAHGRGIAKHIQQTTSNVLSVEHGSLYPALHRLERRGLIKADWGVSDNNRQAKYYSLAKAGRDRLQSGTSSWHRFVDVAGRALRATTPVPAT